MTTSTTTPPTTPPAAIPAFEPGLEQAIRSVLAQSYDNIEFIIVDGGSTDGTLEIIRRYNDRIDQWVSEPDRGLYDAMNKGIALSSGDLIGFLNADDWYEPGAIAAVVEACRPAEGRNTIIAGMWNLVFEEIGLTVRATPSLKFHLGMPISHQAMFVPRGVYDSIGGRRGRAAPHEARGRMIPPPRPMRPAGRRATRRLRAENYYSAETQVLPSHLKR